MQVHTESRYFFANGLPSCLCHCVRVINLELFREIFLIYARRKKVKKKFVLCPVNVITYMHSECAINYDGVFLSFRAYQPL